MLGFLMLIGIMLFIIFGLVSICMILDSKIIDSKHQDEVVESKHQDEVVEKMLREKN